MRRRPFTFTLSFLTALLLGAALPIAQAQEKPPLRIVVGFPPGGSADILARMIANALRDDYTAKISAEPPGGNPTTMRKGGFS